MLIKGQTQDQCILCGHPKEPYNRLIQSPSGLIHRKCKPKLKETKEAPAHLTEWQKEFNERYIGHIKIHHHARMHKDNNGDQIEWYSSKKYPNHDCLNNQCILFRTDMLNWIKEKEQQKNKEFVKELKELGNLYEEPVTVYYEYLNKLIKKYEHV